MLFTNERNAKQARTIQLQRNGTPIPIETEFIFLGVVFDAVNTFRVHAVKIMAMVMWVLIKTESAQNATGKEMGLFETDLAQIYHTLIRRIY